MVKFNHLSHFQIKSRSHPWSLANSVVTNYLNCNSNVWIWYLNCFQEPKQYSVDTRYSGFIIFSETEYIRHSVIGPIWLFVTTLSVTTVTHPPPALIWSQVSGSPLTDSGSASPRAQLRLWLRRSRLRPRHKSPWLRSMMREKYWIKLPNKKTFLMSSKSIN